MGEGTRPEDAKGATCRERRRRTRRQPLVLLQPALSLPDGNRSVKHHDEYRLFH